jgi:hypothetical protein
MIQKLSYGVVLISAILKITTESFKTGILLTIVALTKVTTIETIIASTVVVIKAAMGETRGMNLTITMTSAFSTW